MSRKRYRPVDWRARALKAEAELEAAWKSSDDFESIATDLVGILNTYKRMGPLHRAVLWMIDLVVAKGR